MTQPLPFLVWSLIVLLIVVCMCLDVTILVAVQDIKETKQRAKNAEQKQREKLNVKKEEAKQIGAIQTKQPAMAETKATPAVAIKATDQKPAVVKKVEQKPVEKPVKKKS